MKNSSMHNVAGMNALDISVNAPWGDKKKAKQFTPGANSEVGGAKKR